MKNAAMNLKSMCSDTNKIDLFPSWKNYNLEKFVSSSERGYDQNGSSDIERNQERKGINNVRRDPKNSGSTELRADGKLGSKSSDKNITKADVYEQYITKTKKEEKEEDASSKRDEWMERKGEIGKRDDSSMVDMTKENNGIMDGDMFDKGRNGINEVSNRIVKIDSLYPEDLLTLGNTWQTTDWILMNQEGDLSYVRIEMINLQALVFKNLSMKATEVSKLIQEMVILVEEEWLAIRNARFHSTVEGCLVNMNKMCTKVCFNNIVNGKSKFHELAKKLLNRVQQARGLTLQCDLKISASMRYKWIKKAK